jgi:hypothetical protein
MNALPYAFSARTREPAIDLVRLAQLVDLELLELERQCAAADPAHARQGVAASSTPTSTRAVAAVPASGPLPCASTIAFECAVVVAWVSHYAPEAVPAVWLNRTLVPINTADPWLGLATALVRLAMRDDPDALSHLIAAAVDRQARLRRSATQMLVLLAPRLPSEHDELQAWVSTAVRRAGDDADVALSILMALPMPEDARLEWLQQLVRRTPRLAEDTRVVAWLDGDMTPAPLCGAYLAALDRVVLARLACVLPPVAGQLALDLSGQTVDVRDVRNAARRALYRNDDIPRLPFGTLLRRVAEHPLAVRV